MDASSAAAATTAPSLHPRLFRNLMPPARVLGCGTGSWRKARGYALHKGLYIPPSVLGYCRRGHRRDYCWLRFPARDVTVQVNAPVADGGHSSRARRQYRGLRWSWRTGVCVPRPPVGARRSSWEATSGLHAGDDAAGPGVLTGRPVACVPGKQPFRPGVLGVAGIRRRQRRARDRGQRRADRLEPGVGRACRHGRERGPAGPPARCGADAVARAGPRLGGLVT